MFNFKLGQLFKPTVTPEMKNLGTTWVRFKGEWREVCETCGGNCGQCGLTQRLGCEIPASMAAIVRNSGMWKLK